MGNDVPKNVSHRMAIGAMSNVTDLEKSHITKLRRLCCDIASRTGNPAMVTKEEFTEAVDAVDVSESDREILERLFVMLDKTGEDRINHKELVVGITPFISASTAVKLEFAFEMFDADGAGKLKHADFRFVVMTLNAVASYFGDPCMQTERIDAFVDEAARHLDADTTGFLAILGLGAWCAEQPITLDFIEGRGTSKYGNKPN